jgi:hypothetical protein
VNVTSDTHLLISCNIETESKHGSIKDILLDVLDVMEIIKPDLIFLWNCNNDELGASILKNEAILNL